MLRPEPRPCSPSSEITTHGLRQRSTSREATIPTTPGCQPSPATTIARGAGLRRASALGGEEDARLGLLAVAVEQIELASHLRCARLVLGEQQLERSGGPLHPARGVDARAEPEAERLLPHAGRLHGRDLHECPQPGLARPCQRGQALAHDAPVLVPQRDDVADGCERGQVEVLVGLRRDRGRRRPRRPSESLSATPGRAELGAGVVAERRVHHRAVGQLRARPVVVGHHHVHPGGARGGHLRDGGDPAVDGHAAGPLRAAASRSTVAVESP